MIFSLNNVKSITSDYVITPTKALANCSAAGLHALLLAPSSTIETLLIPIAANYAYTTWNDAITCMGFKSFREFLNMATSDEISWTNLFELFQRTVLPFSDEPQPAPSFSFSLQGVWAAIVHVVDTTILQKFQDGSCHHFQANLLSLGCALTPIVLIRTSKVVQSILNTLQKDTDNAPLIQPDLPSLKSPLELLQTVLPQKGDI